MTFEERMFGMHIDEAVDLGKIVRPRVNNLSTGKKFGSFIIHKGEDGFNPFMYKDIAKQHGGRTWNSPVGDDEDTGLVFPVGSKSPSSVLNNDVKPVLGDIMDNENQDMDVESRKAEIIKVIDDLLEQFKSAMSDESDTDGSIKASKNEVQAKLDELRKRLLSITSAEEFKNVMRPILKFRSMQKNNYSINNTILIWLQDPEATYVDSIGGWNKVGREITENAIRIAVFAPRTRPWAPGERNLIIHDFVESKHKKNAGELNQIEWAQLNRKLRRGVAIINKYTGNPIFDFVHKIVDIRFTRTIDGAQDDFDEAQIGKQNLSDLKWFDDSGQATDETMKLVSAVEDVCKENGIKVNKASAEELRGARGSSSDGGTTITMLRDATQNEDYLKTMIHELTHSLCHWEKAKYPLKDSYDIQEQEAELTAWMVLMMFGYESVTETSMNYIGSWGLDETNAKHVFDTMAKVATYIYNEINYRIKANGGDNIDPVGGDGESVEESFVGRMARGIGRGLKMVARFIKSKLSGGRITGRELAEAFGMGSLYDRSESIGRRRGSMSDAEADDESMMGRLEDGYDPEGDGEMPEYGLS